MDGGKEETHSVDIVAFICCTSADRKHTRRRCVLFFYKLLLLLLDNPVAAATSRQRTHTGVKRPGVVYFVAFSLFRMMVGEGQGRLFIGCLSSDLLTLSACCLERTSALTRRSLAGEQRPLSAERRSRLLGYGREEWRVSAEHKHDLH